MATIYKKPNSKFWYAQYFDATGKRVAKSTGKEKKREAEKAAEDLESEDRKQAAKADFSKPFAVILESAAREADAGGLTLARAAELLERLKRTANPDFRELSLKKAWDEWRANQTDISVSTAKGYSEDQKLFAAAFGDKIMDAPLSSLKASHIQAAMKKALGAQGGKGRAGKPRKGATVNKSLASLRRALEWAVSQKLIPFNPAREIRPLPENDSTEKGPYSAEEVRKLIEAALAEEDPKEADEWSGAILAASQTGMRMGDLVKLADTHLDGNRIVIRPSKTSRSKKTISVPISPQLKKWIGNRKGLFFPTIAKMAPAERSMKFDDIMARAEVSKDIVAPGGIELRRTFHSFRHTFASWLAEANVQSDVRQKLTGHSSSKIHQRYTHHDEALNRAVEKLPAL